MSHHIPNFGATKASLGAPTRPKLWRPYTELLRKFPIGWPSYSIDQASDGAPKIKVGAPELMICAPKFSVGTPKLRLGAHKLGISCRS